ncbi:MAG TPA: plastocyanin/azurin family copper-binding protein [Solirubrobacteraceae bacterium]
MKRAALVLAACAMLTFTAGCGSSKSSGTASTTTTTGTGTKSTAATPKGGLTTDGKINYASPPANAPVQSGLIEISYHEFAIEPDTLKAKVGSTVKWTNNDSEKCNVTSEGGPYKFASGDFGEGGTFELKLDKAGAIHYECTSYPTTMNGTIEVVE